MSFKSFSTAQITPKKADKDDKAKNAMATAATKTADGTASAIVGPPAKS